MNLTLRRLRFLMRWVVFYNARLVWLCLRLPRRHSNAALSSVADERRRRAQLALARVSGDCASVCADCGNCCLESVDRFTPFDRVVRTESDSPAPSWDRRIYSVPWMIYNSVRHGVQRLSPGSKKRPAPACPHLTPRGCGLSIEERPMICVSWFCPRTVFAMSERTLAARERPLLIIETLHRHALEAACGSSDHSS
ncbi:MAG: hypothetical protein Q7T82_12415 [Armatimonadota bacterium]|nr:hypothetical protein [Armatimonadota bacterium]